MAVTNTPRLAIPKPDGNERVRDGDNAISAVADRIDALSGVFTASAAGSVSATISASTASPWMPVTFPAGRFTATPKVMVAMNGLAGGPTVFAIVGSVNASGCQLRAMSAGGSTTVTVQLDWVAFQ